jgi:hypothetical protein
VKPVTFVCEATVPVTPEEIARRILDTANWPDFNGYGPIPGIKVAEFEVRTPDVIGSRVRVTNRDGSRHVEEIVEWHPGRRIRMAFKDLSPPLSRLSVGMEEVWEFFPSGDGTRVRRSFTLHARSAVTRPILWLIAALLKRAIARHLREMK